MNAPQSPSVSRPRLLASTAAITVLFSTTFSAPSMAMQPVVEDVVSEMLMDVRCTGGGNHNQNQVQKPRRSDAGKPAVLRFINADMEAAAPLTVFNDTFAKPALVMQPVVEDIVSEMLMDARCQPQNQQRPRRDAGKPIAIRFIEADTERG